MGLKKLWGFAIHATMKGMENDNELQLRTWCINILVNLLGL